MLWGKLIDHDRCIGCHACSVACKAENDVPLGAFRTWVKQVEKGRGAGARRQFGVLRCNQCEDAPCVAICPTAAMHRRPDGIVDFDPTLCIGCKACIQACPYDAIYIDPSSGTAAKCHFCAHRVDVGLEPACVSVCPTGALRVSDLEDPESFVAKTIAREAVQVRKPALGTRPKVFYKGADESVLDPRAALRPPLGVWGQSRCGDGALDPPGESLEAGRGVSGAPAAARVAYDVPRRGAPWGWKITAYLATKAVGAGALLVGGLLACVRPEALGAWPPVLAFVFLALTQLLLVLDLERPERFLLVVTRPQSRSWLVRGAFVLLGAQVVSALWGLLALVGPPGTAALPAWTWQALGALAIVAGTFAAGYTALLFGQALGRRLWQSPLLFPHLVVQAVVAGCATLALLPGLLDHAGREARFGALGVVLAVALFLNLLMILGELWTHGDEDARLALRWLRSGPNGATLALGVLALGHVFPAVALYAALTAPGAAVAVAVAGPAALVGVVLWDHLYVQAGQAPPLS